ncbi:DUF5320 domain-containing protein [Desulfofundulus salinus]|uniref:DUF5320 domain-containing protein n=1 Tax=Desulfofundulus salinus TaxID=2419843 RepID=A0A494WWH3_9FIRM|nr:DUF5320 domain-containing protein [Desulfofundulus salinum]RKO66612.1 hypothetical protein D7024_06405 [Desulfofundulus salinum]
MPRGDRTGPWGMGAMTGRAMGYCAGYSVPGFASAPGWWCRPRRGSGWGAGRRSRFWWGGFPPATGTPYVPYFPAPPENEPGVLKAHISHLENILQAFKQRLEQIQERSKGQTEQE